MPTGCSVERFLERGLSPQGIKDALVTMPCCRAQESRSSSKVQTSAPTVSDQSGGDRTRLETLRNTVGCTLGRRKVVCVETCRSESKVLVSAWSCRGLLAETKDKALRKCGGFGQRSNVLTSTTCKAALRRLTWTHFREGVARSPGDRRQEEAQDVPKGRNASPQASGHGP